MISSTTSIRWMCLFVTLGIVTILSGKFASVSAADPVWPQWRGPNRDAVCKETGLLKTWPEGGPKLLWKNSDVGRGFSSIAVVGKKAFTMGDRKSGSVLICVDVESGKENWSTALGKTGGNYDGTRSTPTVDGDLVYALGQFGDLICCEVETGKEVWRKHVVNDFGGRKGDGWNYSESPLIDGDNLICTPGGKTTMVALSKKTGEKVWGTSAPSDPGAGHSSVVVAVVDGVRTYVTLTAGGVVSFTTDGKFLWEYGKGKIAPNTANIPTCIVQESQVFCTAGYGKGGALLQLTKNTDGAVNAEELWFERGMNNKHGGFVLVNGRLYGDQNDGGSPLCAELKTGKIVWQKKSRSEGRGSATMLYAEDRLYIRYDNGVMVLAEAGTDSYKEVGSFKIPHSSSNSWSHPVICNGKMYIKEQGYLMCYDIKQ